MNLSKIVLSLYFDRGTMPKVSVIIPTYNRARYICRAVNSVLNQTITDHEIIIVDDGSTDNTKEVLAQYDNRIVYLPQSNKGISASRNRGISAARGKYIAFLDSDDWWAPEKLAEQVKVLDANPKVGIVYSRMPIVNEKGKKLGTKPAGVSGKNFKELLEVWGDLPTSTVMTRRECLDRVGVFDCTLPPVEDIDLWLRISQFYDLYEIEGKVLAYYFRHSEQTTASRIKVHNGLVKIYRKILNTFDDIPRDLFIKRVAMSQYTLSREYYFEKFYVNSLRNVVAVILRYPLVGTLFFNEGDNLLTKALKFIKPYGFLAVCFIVATVQSVFNLFQNQKEKSV